MITKSVRRMVGREVIIISNALSSGGDVHFLL